jgi:2-dehydropantoate 2-reductase
MAVAHAAGIRITRDLHPVIRAIAESMATQYSSTAQDLAAGKPSEIDHLNGYVVRKGEQLGIPTPANRMLQVIVHLMERRDLQSR